MLKPKKTKYMKAQKGKVTGKAVRGIIIRNGGYGLIAQEPGRIDAKEIEAARVAINRRIKKINVPNKLWIRIFPNVPVTKKPTEVRMGQGKGPVDRWICRVKENRVLIEIGKEIPDAIAKNALKAASHKISVLTKITKRRGD